MGAKQTATIVLEGFMVNVLLGVYDQEREKKQSVLIDISIETDCTKAIASDRIEDTLNYHAWALSMRKEVSGTSFYLLEALGDYILQHLQDYDDRICAASVMIRKFNVVAQCASCGVKMQRTFNRS